MDQFSWYADLFEFYGIHFDKRIFLIGFYLGELHKQNLDTSLDHFLEKFVYVLANIIMYEIEDIVWAELRLNGIVLGGFS